MLQDTFPFFPQYAQSVSFWAPDSSAFAYAGAVGDEPGIWIQDLEGDAPTKVSDGTWVAWSGATS
jgi:TolB protein